ncbi:MAG: hypothetical protein J6I40_06750 [Mailhella sp.]|nr:hypothetical protein [Mailhella sp.]
MADLHLSKPAAGSVASIPCAQDSRFVFDFPTADASLSRQGDALVFSFEDGSSVQLEDFYKTYNSEQMPSFAMDGVEVAGPDFFMAMNQEDLMPAAGPSAGNGVNGSGHYNEYANMDLLGGLNRIGGLDLGWVDDVNPETEGAAGGHGDIIELEDIVYTPTDSDMPTPPSIVDYTPPTNPEPTPSVPTTPTEIPTEPTTPEEPATPNFKLAVMFNMGKNSEYSAAGVTKLGIAFEEVLKIVQDTLKEHDGIIDLGIIPYAARAYTPGTNSYLWDIGDKGEWKNFTENNLIQLRTELQQMYDLRGYDTKNTNGSFDQWLKAHHVAVDADVQYNGTVDNDGKQIWDIDIESRDRYFSNNNYEDAFNAATSWFNSFDSLEGGSAAVTLGGFMANYAYSFYGRYETKIYSYTLSVNEESISKKIEENDDNLYSDDLFEYRINHNTNIIEYRLKDSTEDTPWKNFDNDDNGNKIIKDIELDFTNLVISDGKQFEIAGEEYKVVYHMLDGYLYKKDASGMYNIDGSLHIMNSNDTHGKHADLPKSGYWNSAVIPDNEGKSLIWDAAGVALDRLKETVDQFTFVKLYEGANGEKDHDLKLIQFTEYLIDHGHLSPDAIITVKELSDVDVDNPQKIYSGTDRGLIIGEDNETNGTDNNDLIFGRGYDDSVQNNLEHANYEDIIHGGKGTDVIFGGSGHDTLYGDDGNDLLFGGSGSDKLYGGEGDDYLNGGEGDDYLNGGEGRDILVGGSGNDILVYDANDYVLEGGDGIDFLLSNDGKVSLEDLLNNDTETGPKVNDVEVLLKGEGIDSLSSLADLAKEGITLEDGKVELEGWKQNADNPNVFTHGDLTLETTLTVESVDMEAQTAVLIMQNNG